MSSSTNAETTLRVGKAQAENFFFTPLDVGDALGTFAKHGVKVEIYNFGGGAKMQQGLAAGAVDLGLGSGPELAFVAKGAPVIGVAAMADAPGIIVLTVLKDGPIATLEQLKGRRVSVSSKGSLTDWLARELGRHMGWGAQGFEIVPLGAITAEVAALETRQIDGAIIELATAYRLEAEGKGRILLRFGELVRDFHIHVIFARRAFVAADPEAIRAFLAGWFDTVEAMRADRARTVAIGAKVMSVSPEIAARLYDELMPGFNPTGRFNPKALDTLAASFVEMKMLPAAPDMASLVTEAFLPAQPR